MSVMNRRKATPSKPTIPKPKLTPQQKIKNLLCFILILAGGYVLIYALMEFGAWSEQQDVREIERSKTSVIGTIVRVGSLAVAEYFVDGKRYERKQSFPASPLYPGEHYVIIYKAASPWISRIDFARPVFLDEDETAKTTGTIISKDGVKIGFTYVVYGKTIKRFQKYILGKGLEKGQTYPVKYLLSNPEVSIIML